MATTTKKTTKKTAKTTTKKTTAKKPTTRKKKTAAERDLSAFGKELRRSSAAVRLHRSKFGIKRSLTDPQISAAAETFGADRKFMAAAKRLLDTKDEAYRSVGSILSRAASYWRAMTIPFPEDGVRLIRRDRIKEFESQMAEFRTELAAAVSALQSQYGRLRAEAEKRLGSLFNAADYPARIDGEFSMAWDYPSFDPPGYLRDISPALYAQQQERLQRQFDEAVHLTEQAMVAEMTKIVTRLTERLLGDEDGKPKKFKDASVHRLRDFFDRFAELNLGSNDALEAIVTDAKKMLGDTQPESLRKDGDLRKKIGEKLAGLTPKLEAMTVDKPKRAISLDDDD